MKDYSQYGEAKVIAEVFNALGIDKGHAVEFGAGDGIALSNTRNLTEKGWTASLYDGDPRGSKEVEQAWIDLEWARKPVPPPCNFLSIDIDGMDYWILRELLSAWQREGISLPDLIVAEYNPIHGRHEAVTIPCNEAHRWDGTTYYGASLAAFELLANEFDYTPIRTNAGINVFLLRNDHAQAHPELIKPLEYVQKWNHARHNPALPWITLN